MPRAGKHHFLSILQVKFLVLTSIYVLKITTHNKLIHLNLQSMFLEETAVLNTKQNDILSSGHVPLTQWT